MSHDDIHVSRYPCVDVFSQQSDFAEPDTDVENSAQTDGDDDFISFAIGFDLGDTTSPAADYLLPDWKRVLKDTVSLSSVFSTLP